MSTEHIESSVPENEDTDVVVVEETHVVPLNHSRGLKRSREIIDSTHLSTLISSYSGHFAEYSKGRSRVTQIIPSVVWKKVCFLSCVLTLVF